MRASKRRRPLGVSGLALVLALAAGCGSSSDKGDGTTTTSRDATGSTATSTPVVNDDALYGGYFPDAVGTTWVYVTNGSLPDTTTATITTSTVQAGGDHLVTVAMTSATHPSGDFSIRYLFHADGTVSVPRQNVTVAQGSTVDDVANEVRWPSLPDLRAGKTNSGTISVPVGRSTTETVSLPWSEGGGGTAKTVVPAGTFDTVVLVTGSGPGAPTVRTYLAKGVGIVETDLGGGTTTQLTSFTPGTR